MTHRIRPGGGMIEPDESGVPGRACRGLASSGRRENGLPLNPGALFIPPGYRATPTDRTLLWTSPAPHRAEPWEALLDGSVIDMERRLGLALTCRLHVVVYATHEEACASLQRPVPTSMLLAPVLGPDDSVIAVQSAAADPANADRGRMHRHLCHELAHVFVALRTGSEKRLGDGDRNLKVAPSLNEGFAECAAALATNQRDVIERALAREAACSGLDLDLDVALNDLTAEHRSTAFALATAQVWRAIQEHGLIQVFRNLENLPGLGGTTRAIDRREGGI